MKLGMCSEDHNIDTVANAGVEFWITEQDKNDIVDKMWDEDIVNAHAGTDSAGKVLTETRKKAKLAANKLI